MKYSSTSFKSKFCFKTSKLTAIFLLPRKVFKSATKGKRNKNKQQLTMEFLAMDENNDLVYGRTKKNVNKPLNIILSVASFPNPNF